MPHREIPGLHEFLREYKNMAIRPCGTGDATVISGEFDFRATHPKFGTVDDAFEIKIEVLPAFPKTVPRVWELAKKIPIDGRHHVNAIDGTLCLGSPIRLLLLLHAKPTLVGFAENCLIPYFFAISRKLNGSSLAFNELAHGNQGLLDDYREIFGVHDPAQAGRTVKLLGMKKRLANKYRCPCGCGKRLGKCRFNFKVRKFRGIANRSWYREQHLSLLEELSSLN
jgi:hypothetical protein